MNSITIAGRVGRDSELRTTSSGTSVASFPVASSRKYNGEETTTWFECTLWGKQAEVLSQYIKKGGIVTVSGRCDLDVFQKNDGTTGAKIKVNVNDVALQGGKSDNEGQAVQQPQQQAPQQQGQQQAPPNGAHFKQNPNTPVSNGTFGQQQPSGQPAPRPQQPQQPQQQQPAAFDDFDDDIPFN